MVELVLYDPGVQFLELDSAAPQTRPVHHRHRAGTLDGDEDALDRQAAFVRGFLERDLRIAGLTIATTSSSPSW